MKNSSLITVIILIAGAIMFNIFSKSSSGVDISVNEFKEMVEKKPGVIIDVRTRVEYEQGHLTKSDELIDFMSPDFRNKVSELDKDKTYYLYCRSGNRSGQAARIMKGMGFEQVYNIGGFEELRDAGIEAE
jgi:phage shock protein E